VQNNGNVIIRGVFQLEMCEYSEICSHYVPNRCDYDNHWLNCDVYRMFDSILDKQVFKSRIHKRIFREEHGHHQEERSPYE